MTEGDRSRGGKGPRATLAGGNLRGELPRPREVQILAVLAMTNLVSYAARNALLTVYPDLRARFSIDDAQIGLLQTVFMLPHAAATLLFGWAGDRYDRWGVIVAGMAG